MNRVNSCSDRGHEDSTLVSFCSCFKREPLWISGASFYRPYVLPVTQWIVWKCGWLGNLVAKALDLQVAGCEFNSRPRHCRVTILGKLFTPTCLSRSQWFSSGMTDCGVRGRGQLCLSRQRLRCTSLGMGGAPFLQCLGRLSLPPSTGR